MEANIKGIKCDNPDCDFRDDSVTWDDYDKTVSEWLNKPCPKCGANLLTQEYVDYTKKFMFVMDELGKISVELFPESAEETARIRVESNGEGISHISDGKMEFDLNPQIVDAIYDLLQTPEGRQSVAGMISASRN